MLFENETMIHTDLLGGFTILPFPPTTKDDGTPYVDSVSLSIRDFGCWEPDETEMVIEIFKSAPDKNALFLDVGAQLGYYSQIAGKLGFGGYAFEREPRVYARMAEGLRLNGLAESFKTFNGYVTKSSEGKNRTVDCIALDDLNITQRVRLLKVDVEGFDPDVVAGAMKLFNNRQVDYAIVEISPAFAHKTPTERYINMTVELAALGYKVYDIGLSPRRRYKTETNHLSELAAKEITPVTVETVAAKLQNIRQTNFLFILS